MLRESIICIVFAIPSYCPKTICDSRTAEAYWRRSIKSAGTDEPINMGEWLSDQDSAFIAEQRTRLGQHKRKLEEAATDDDLHQQVQQLQTRIADLENNVEQEVQRRLGEERRQFKNEKRRHRQIQNMMDAANRTVAELRTTATQAYKCARSNNRSETR